MATIAEKVDQLLRRFDKEDPLYKALVSDVNGVPAGTINIPTDYDIGAIGSVLEYTRQLAMCLLTQMRTDLADTVFVDLVGQQVLGIARFSGESDTDYVNRMYFELFGWKVTCPAIVNAAWQFSPGGIPQCLPGDQGVAYADYSFASMYEQFQNQTPGNEFDYWTWPAIAGSGVSGSFFFVLIVQGTPPADVPKVVQVVNSLIAAGVDWELQVVV